jgi:hypothetical protein
MRASATTIVCAAIAVLLTPASGCAHRHQATWKHEQIEQMRGTLAEQVPPGTPIATAQAFMEKEGFTCTAEVNGTFVEHERWADKGKAHEGISYLRCYRVNVAGLMMSRIWTVALVNDGECVTDILISMYVDGP